MPRLCIIEDKDYFREMLVEIIAVEGRYEVVGEAADGQAAIEMCLTLTPDVCLVDAMLPELSGAEFLRAVTKRLPRMRVVVFTGHENPGLVFEMIEAGAHGIVEKTAGVPELMRALTVVTRGDMYLSPTIAALLPAASAFSAKSAQRSSTFDELVAKFRGR